MIDSHKKCSGCNNGTMHRIDNIEEKMIRGYYCPSCRNWESVEIPLYNEKQRKTIEVLEVPEYKIWRY